MASTHTRKHRFSRIKLVSGLLAIVMTEWVVALPANAIFEYHVSNWNCISNGVISQTSGVTQVEINATAPAGVCETAQPYHAVAGPCGLYVSHSVTFVCNFHCLDVTALVQADDLVFSYTGGGVPDVAIPVSMNMYIGSASSSASGSVVTTLTAGISFSGPFSDVGVTIPGLYVPGVINVTVGAPQGIAIHLVAGIDQHTGSGAAEMSLDTVAGSGPVFNLPADYTANSAQLGITNNEWVCDSPAGVPQDRPAATFLHEATPNPFNPTTTLSFSLASPGLARLSIYDVNGRLVRTLLDDHFSAGERSVIWEGLDDQGNRVASGVYFYRLNTEHFVESKRMVLLK